VDRLENYNLKITLERLAVCFFVCVAAFGCGSEAVETPAGLERVILESAGKVSSKELYRTVKDLQDMGARFTWQEQDEAAEYVRRRLEGYGIEVVFDEYFFNERKWKNVVASLSGKGRPTEIIMAISHLDSISKQPGSQAPGADDNGSGTAALIEIARVLSKAHLQSTVKFVIFSNEEQGRGGSKHFAKRARNEGIDIKGVINLDIIGYNNPNASGAPDKSGLIESAKSVARAARGQAYRILYPHGRIIIAGRPENKSLVDEAASPMKRYTKLGVSAMVGEDCG